METNLILKITARFVLLILIQVFLLNNINLMGYINPYLYVLFIILYPVTGNKTTLIILSFLLGLSIDIFENSGGVHAAASVCIAYIRSGILRYSFGLSYEHNNIKLSRATPAEKITYIGSMILIHHLILFLLEVFNFNHILLVLKSTLFSGIFSFILIYSSIVLFSRKEL